MKKISEAELKKARREGNVASPVPAPVPAPKPQPVVIPEFPDNSKAIMNLTNTVGSQLAGTNAIIEQLVAVLSEKNPTESKRLVINRGSNNLIKTIDIQVVK